MASLLVRLWLRPDARSARRAFAAALGAVALSGCPLPVSHTVTTSPPVVGRLEWADASPAANVPIVLASGRPDSRCTGPNVSTRTDAAGIFHFAADTQHFDVTWIIPNLDLVRPTFRLCAAVGDSLKAGYDGWGSPYTAVPLDTVRCVVWDLRGTRRINCAGRSGNTVADGGRWTADTGVVRSGFYRLFLITERARVQDSSATAPGERSLHVQWVARDSATIAGSTRLRVVATETLPIDMPYAQNVWLWRRDGRWMASVDHGTAQVPREAVFELGPPGHVTLVANP